MSGRGRGATLPAWMTSNGSTLNNPAITTNGSGAFYQGQFDDHQQNYVDTKKLNNQHLKLQASSRSTIAIAVGNNVPSRRSRSRYDISLIKF
jgi:hypothetical protein